jgi:hypothetical protein
MDLLVLLPFWQPHLFEHHLLHQSFLEFSLLQMHILRCIVQYLSKRGGA